MVQKDIIIVTGEMLVKKKGIIIGIVLGSVALIVAAALLFMSWQKKDSVNKQLNLAGKYLAEMNYEEAVAAFEAIIVIEPQNEAAIKGLQDTYVSWADQYYDAGDFESAQKVLEECKAKLDSYGIDTTIISDKLAELERKDEQSAQITEPIIEEDEYEEEYVLIRESCDSPDSSWCVEYELDENGYKVRSSNHSEFHYPDFEDVSDKYSEYEYNEDRTECTGRGYDKDGTLQYTYIEKYDNNGLLIEMVEEAEYGKTICRYDANGNEIETLEYDENGDYRQWRYEYEGERLTKYIFRTYEDSECTWEEEHIHDYVEVEKNVHEDCEKFTYYEMGELTYNGEGNITRYTYNDEGQLLMEEVFADGDYVYCIGRREYTYDADGNVESIITTERFGKEIPVDEYYENGKLVHTVNYNDDGGIESYSDYQYDADGNEILAIDTGADGNEIKRVEKTYDANGNLLSEIWYDEAGKQTYAYAYEYALIKKKINK